MRKQIPWSWTRLDCFEQCPKKFKMQYITKEFPPFNADAPHIKKGKGLHKVMENYLKHGEVLPYPIEYKGETYHIHLEFLYPLLDKLHEADIKLIEENVCFGINMKRLTWFDRSAWCRVIFDVLIVIDDFALIVDWKSGKVKQYSDQLKLFAGAAFELFPQVNRVLTSYIWLEHPNKKPTWAEYKRSDNDDIWHEFGDRAELIQMANESGNWPAKKNMFCKWCDSLPSQCEFKECD